MKKTKQKEARCVCQEPGHFRSGVPGILAHVENGRILSKVERCDACLRFRDDAVAEEVLRSLLEKRAPQFRGCAPINYSRRRS